MLKEFLEDILDYLEDNFKYDLAMLVVLVFGICMAYLELENCGENAFMLRTVLEDIVSRPQPAKLNLYRGDMTSTAWEEIADAFYVRPDDLKDNIDVHAYLVDGFCK